MLILDASQVEYCPVLQPVGNATRVVPGAAYRGRLFVKGEVFARDRREEAVQLSRARFEEYGGLVYVLLVDNGQTLTLWYQNDAVRRTKVVDDLVAAIELQLLVEQMRSPSGVQVKTRRQGWRSYPGCFLGNEAIAWLRAQLHLSRAEALRLGQRLLEEGWIDHIEGDRGFEDKPLFYRFRT